MTQPADRIFRNADGHTLGESDERFEAVAVRDGRVVRVGSDYEIGFLEGVETDVVDCAGGTLLPGFIDAHTHMEVLGRRLVHADLGGTTDRSEALNRLRKDVDGGWIFGYGYDDSTWPTEGYLTRDELDSVSETDPVVAFREDLHLASVNSVVLERYSDEIPESGLERESGTPTGVLTETAAEFIRTETAPDREETKQLIIAARDRAHELGVTGVHDMVRRSSAPAAYRELAREGELDLRVRLYYWADHLDAVAETGLITNGGGPFVEVGGIKTYTDGSIGAGTAKLTAPYTDREGTGEWVVDPEELAGIVDRADDLGLQVAIHAIGDAAVLAALAELPAGESRHRIEHAELLPEDLSGFDVVASMQPNFLRWAHSGGLYETRLGGDRTTASNRFSDVLDADVPLAFGSDCMPLNPLYGIRQAVTAQQPSQRLTVREALRAYTAGSAYAGHDEDRFGIVAPGKCADFVVLEKSPWDVDPIEIDKIDVSMTVIDGKLVYRGGTE